MKQGTPKPYTHMCTKVRQNRHVLSKLDLLLTSDWRGNVATNQAVRIPVNSVYRKTKETEG